MAILKEITENYPNLKIDRYKAVNKQRYQQIKSAGKSIKGLHVFHVNATAYGGGVAEMQWSRVPLERSAGVKSHWLVIDQAPKEFFDVTKKMHNLLQGKPGILTEAEKSIYLSVNRELAKSLKNHLKKYKSGIVIIHDPQPLPTIVNPAEGFTYLLRLHIDLSTPTATTLEFLRPYISQYKAVIISNTDYKPSFLWLPPGKIKIVMPAIDPLADKNLPMSLEAAHRIIESFGINPTKPILTQVSRFDPWKDPMGVLNAYYRAKNKIADLQLVMAGFLFAKDDPESISVFKQVKKHARGDNDIYLFADPKKLKEISNDDFVNALYTSSLVVIQKSIREGFGLTMTEAMWKGKAVVAGITSGSRIQIKDGKNGLLINTSREAAKAIVRLAKDEPLRKRLGKAGQKSVTKDFLLPRLILDFLRLYKAYSKPAKK